MKVKCINLNGYDGDYELIKGNIYTVEDIDPICNTYLIKEFNSWFWQNRFEIINCDESKCKKALNNKIKRIEDFIEHKKFEQNFDRTPSLGGFIKGLEKALAILEDDK